MRKGIPISPGIAVARVYRVDELFSRHESQRLDVHALGDEIRRYNDACAAASAEIETLADRVEHQVGRAEAEIFRAHRTLLHDPTLIAKVHSIILYRRVDAATAVHDVLDEYQEVFSRIQDERLKERLADVRDVLGRVLNHLQEPPAELRETLMEPVVIVAREILPSQAAMLHQLKVAAIITEMGGPSGHAAILARAMGIPAVSGLNGIVNELHTGDLIAVDGREGHVYPHPGTEVEAAFRKLQREFGNLKSRVIGNRDVEAVSRDGVGVDLLANVNGPADAVLAVEAGASGVGLYRTEFLFLAHPSVPDEEEQLAAYRDVIVKAPNHRVTIRTLDLGGDKHVPYLGSIRETNPFLGWRSIRMSADHPDFFRSQLRAILRASADGEISLLFPMVSTLEEVRKLKGMVREAQQSLRKQNVPFAKCIPIGVMVEVPAAALSIHAILREVDFISIGSNDLIQYVMAADRDNPKVAHLCEPFSPAVMRILNHVIKAGVKHNKPVTLCGEMAGRPRCFLPLFGMGLRRFSMSPAFVPTIKEIALSADVTTSAEIARRVLRMRTVKQIRNYLTERTQAVCPNVARLDVSR